MNQNVKGIISIYRDTRWGPLQQTKEGGEAVTFEFNHDKGSISYPFIKRRAGILDGIEYFDIVTPRGVGGPFIEDCSYESRSILANAFNDFFQQYCFEHGIVAEYVRFEPWVENERDFRDIYDMHPYGQIYCNDLTIDFFKEEYSDKRRGNIRRAEKNGVIVEFDTLHGSIEKFLSLYEYIAAKYAVKEYYSLTYDFIYEYCARLPEETVFAAALYEGTLISTAIILMGQDICHYHFVANHPEYSSLQGNSLLVYRTSLYAAEKGKKLIDLGSATVGSPLEAYKSGFIYHGRRYPVSVGTKIRNEDIYNKLVEQAGGPRENFFPAYRR